MMKLRLFVVLLVGGISGIAQASSPVPNGELLVSDLATNRVLAFDANSGDFRRVVVQNDPNLSSPAGMTIGFGGDLFVASQATGEVLRYNAVTGAPKGTTPGSSAFLSLGVDPSGLLYDSINDRLFVGLFGAASSNEIKIFNSAGTETGSIQMGPMGGRTGMALDADGNLYVNSFNEDGYSTGSQETGAILKFSGPDFTTMTTLIAGDSNYQTYPIIAGMNGLAISDSNYLYSASLFGQQVIKISTGGAVAGIIGSQAPPTAYPSGIVIDDQGTVLVSTLGNNNPADPIYGAYTFPGSVQKFDQDGNFQGVLIDGSKVPGPAFIPTSMALARDPVPGDFNGDYVVDGADFTIWQATSPIANGGTLASGDADGDGDVDGADFIVWQTHYPTTNPSDTSAVPEPAAWLAASLGLIGIVGARRKGFFPRSKVV